VPAVFNRWGRIFNQVISTELTKMAKKEAKFEDFLNMEFLCFLVGDL
jgi:hypothetical protein